MPFISSLTGTIIGELEEALIKKLIGMGTETENGRPIVDETNKQILLGCTII